MKTTDGRAALENYRSTYDDARKVFSNQPRHDWASHGASAFAQFAVGYEPAVNARAACLPFGDELWRAGASDIVDGEAAGKALC